MSAGEVANDPDADGGTGLTASPRRARGCGGQLPLLLLGEFITLDAACRWQQGRPAANGEVTSRLLSLTLGMIGRFTQAQ